MRNLCLKRKPGQIFLQRFSAFSKWNLNWTFLETQSFQWIQSEAGPLFDKKVRKATPLHNRHFSYAYIMTTEFIL